MSEPSSSQPSGPRPDGRECGLNGRRVMNGLRLKSSIYLILLAVLLLAPASRPAAAADAVISRIEAGEQYGRVRFALEMDQPLKFSFFTLAEPYRVVIDLPEVGWRLPQRPLPGEQAIFKQVRYGQFQPGHSRVVLDFKAPVKITEAFARERVGGYEIILVADRTARAGFLASLSDPPRHVTDVRPLSRGAPPPAAVKLTPPAATKADRLEVVAQRRQNLVAPPAAPPSSAELNLISSQYLPMPPRRPGSIPAYRRPLIVIDPGHGGVDPGALGQRGVYEKHVVLALSRELQRQLLKTRRYRADLTRERDVFIRLRDRVAIAREKKAHLFISIHADTTRDKKISGPSVYTLSEKASDKEAAELAERENKADLIAGIDLSHESADVTNILIDLAQRESMNQSAQFASMLVRSLSKSTKVLPRPHRFAGFAVLKAPDLPSVLVETGFLSNREDQQRLTSKTYRSDLAAAIVDAIDTYFGSIEQAKIR